MKKVLSVVLALVMIFMFTACGDNKNGTNDISRQEQQSTTPFESAPVEAKGESPPAETEVVGSQAETVDNIDTEEGSKMKISLAIGDTVFTATMIDNETTREFVSLLPLTLQMNDLFSREKYAHLPRAISEGGGRQRTYEIGDVVYWPPGPDFAIYYRHDGQSLNSGIIPMGKIDSGIEVFKNYDGSVEVTIENLTEKLNYRSLK